MLGLAACPWTYDGQSASDGGAKSSRNGVWLSQELNASFGHGRRCSTMLRQATEARPAPGWDCEVASAFLMQCLHAENYASQQSTPCVRLLL